MTDNMQRAREPKFGDWIRGIYASERNPIRDGIYVRTTRRNHETLYELTDGKGKFWMYPKRSTERLDRPNAFDAAALRLAVPEEAVEQLTESEKDVALGQAVEFAEYVERQAKGTMRDAAKRFLSLPYSQEIAARLAAAQRPGAGGEP